MTRATLYSACLQEIERSTYPVELTLLQSSCMPWRKVTACVEEAAGACRVDRTKGFPRVEAEAVTESNWWGLKNAAVIRRTFVLKRVFFQAKAAAR